LQQANCNPVRLGCTSINGPIRLLFRQPQAAVFRWPASQPAAAATITTNISVYHFEGLLAWYFIA